MSEADIEERYWRPHNEWAGDELYSICVDLRGFYLKVCSALLLPTLTLPSNGHWLVDFLPPCM